MAKKSATDLFNEAERLVRNGRHDLAPARYREAIRAAGSHPNVVKVRARLGEVLLRNGRFDEATREFERVAAAAPSAEIDFRLAQAHTLAGRREKAGPLLDRFIAVMPQEPKPITRAAMLLQYLGREDEAAALLDRTIAGGVASREVATVFASLAIRVGRVEEGIGLLKPHAEDPALPAIARGALMFSLARLLDHADLIDEAWSAYTEANRLTRRPFDAAADERKIDLLIERYTVDAIRRIAQTGSEGERAVLVVGMPRSGTTLVERILGGHPRVEIGGELRALDDAIQGIPGTSEGEALPPLNRVRGTAVTKARRAYLEVLSGVSSSADRVTDKMPTNFRHLGVVPALLPGGTVIHCSRDLRDVALSCYFRGFVGGNAFSHDLVDIARYIKGYLRLMRHWEAVLPEACPEFRYLTVEYERVSMEPETEARRMVEATGLEWDPACVAVEDVGKVSPTLEPDQVNRGVYSSSVARWRRYERHLRPFIEAMGDQLPA